jgi:muramidase (phage lysozyme)
LATLKLDKPVAAFLDLIAASEGTSTNPLTRADGYDIIVTGVDGPHLFTDFSVHPFSLGRPPILVRAGKDATYSSIITGTAGKPIQLTPAVAEVRSTASGRYQLILPTWAALCQKCGSRTFSAANQDLAAIQLLLGCGAYDELLAGHISTAIDKACETWASFPGNPYQQGGRSLDWLLTTYEKCLEAQSV